MNKTKAIVALLVGIAVSAIASAGSQTLVAYPDTVDTKYVHVPTSGVMGYVTTTGPYAFASISGPFSSYMDTNGGGSTIVSGPSGHYSLYASAIDHIAIAVIEW